MLCEQCREREARYAISMTMGETTTVRHLCDDCMRKWNMTIQSGNVTNLLSSILSAITERQSSDSNAEQPAPCPICGTTYQRFRETGKLGCPACYDAFRESLQPMLLQIHGRTQHAGRHPLETEAAQRTRTRREELSRQLEQAVALEDFETAAQLRDQLRALKVYEEANVHGVS